MCFTRQQIIYKKKVQIDEATSCNEADIRLIKDIRYSSLCLFCGSVSAINILKKRWRDHTDIRQRHEVAVDGSQRASYFSSLRPKLLLCHHPGMPILHNIPLPLQRQNKTQQMALCRRWLTCTKLSYSDELHSINKEKRIRFACCNRLPVMKATEWGE